MRLSEVIALPVRTESGVSLGHVHDVRAELTESELRITGLLVGRIGLLARLGLGAPDATERLRSREVLPWSSLVRVDRRGVVVSDEVTSTPPSSQTGRN